jgi:hypothetical protein
MIGDDCPSFTGYEDAFRAFFYGEFFRSPGAQVPAEFAIVRVVMGAAWIERVTITLASLQVQVGGSNVIGARLELNGATYRADARVTETGQVQLPLPDGLPAGAYLYLSRNRQWLDYRAMGEYRGQADYDRAGVEIEVPEDPDAEIQALLSQGEGQATFASAGGGPGLLDLLPYGEQAGSAPGAQARWQARKEDGDEQPVCAHPGRWQCRGPRGHPGSCPGAGRGHLDHPARRGHHRDVIRPVHFQRHQDRHRARLPLGDRQRHAQAWQRAARLPGRLAVRRRLHHLHRPGYQRQ